MSVRRARTEISSFFDEREEAWPYNKNYDGWWGHDTLPKLNYEDSPTLEEYILNIGKKWVSPPYNADGWRLDVAADLGYSNEYNHIFWENFRKSCKKCQSAGADIGGALWRSGRMASGR